LELGYLGYWASIRENPAQHARHIIRSL